MYSLYIHRYMISTYPINSNKGYFGSESRHTFTLGVSVCLCAPNSPTRHTTPTLHSPTLTLHVSVFRSKICDSTSLRTSIVFPDMANYTAAMTTTLVHISVH